MIISAPSGLCVRVAVTLAIATAITPTSALAEPTRWALVVGVGQYASPRIHTLDGPRFDAQSVRDEIVGRWGFPPANVRLLINEHGTKKNILDSIDWLAAASRRGDVIFIFYSGHGTSRQDRNVLHYGLHPTSGAIFPYDVVTDSEQSVIDTLIIGRRDLRPRLDRLDEGRNVLVVIDSCFSKNATRSLAQAVGSSKSEALFGPLEGFAATATSEPYPYRNVVSLSAASEAEEAMDIGYNALSQGAQTIDGNPKGSLTDALLRGLRGDADTNHDRVLTIGELYEFVRQQVTAHFTQTPQLVLPEGHSELASTPVFASTGAPPGEKPSEPSHFQTATNSMFGSATAPTLRVRVDGISPNVGRRIASIDGVSVTASQYDVRVAADPIYGLVLYDSSGDVLKTFDAAAVEDLLHRLERERYARLLVTLTLPEQTFNVHLDLPSPTGVLQSGKSYTLTCEVEGTASLVVLNIDKDAMVSVLAPANGGEAQPRHQWTLSGIRVTPPEGTEFVKVFAFRQAPRWINTLIDANLAIPADAEAIKAIVSNALASGQNAAEARLKVVTVR